MFDIGFSEVLLIFVIALVVLGPEKLPRVASQVGRWVGRARAMARQFREQLEEEVNLEEVRKAHEVKPKRPAEPPAQPANQTDAGPQNESTAGHPPGIAQEPPQQHPFTTVPDPMDLRADTFSHAHPTNEYGANPLTPDGAPEARVPPAQSEVAAWEAPASAPVPAGSQAQAQTNNPERAVGGEMSASNTPSTITPREGSGAIAPNETSPSEKPRVGEHGHS